jgi:nucleoside-diphosphate-sugar epimerase
MSSVVAKRILVTGGAGFLGSHLCERLVARGEDVLCVDNYFTGRKDNIVHLLGEAHFEAMRHDVTHPLYVEVDEIYNLSPTPSAGSRIAKPTRLRSPAQMIRRRRSSSTMCSASCSAVSPTVAK